MSEKKPIEDKTPPAEDIEILDEEPDSSELIEEVEILDADEPELEALATDDEASSTLAEAISTQLDEFKAALQRERADFVNYKKRTEREKIEMYIKISAETIAKFLPILDDFERALQSVPEDVQENGWLTGFKMIHKKFTDILAQLHVEIIDPLGEPFDPNLHEAIGSEDSDDYESDTVTAVLQKGYKLEDRVIRVAMVKVAN